jgi:site-specific recombinase XerC
MLSLRHGCYASTPKISPSNWKQKSSIKKNWFVYYRFYDPSTKNNKGKIIPKQVVYKDVNKYKDHTARIELCKSIINDMVHMLTKQHYNPWNRKVEIEHATEISSATPLIEALEWAYFKLKSVKGTKEDAKSALKYITPAIVRMNLNLPIEDVAPIHIKRLLDYMEETESYFTPEKYNRYRANLQMLFKVIKKNFIIKINPATEMDPQQTIKKIRLTLTNDERKKINEFLAIRNPRFLRFIHIFFHSGAREIELMGVQGYKVDLKNQTYKCIVRKRKSGPVEVEKVIKDIALPLWEEAMKDCGPNDFVFAKDLKPGAIRIHESQIGRRWKRWVKNKLGIKADFYSLKHSNTSEVVDLLSEQEAAKLNSHTSTDMVAKVYDIKKKDRQHERIKNVGNRF